MHWDSAWLKKKWGVGWVGGVGPVGPVRAV